MLDESREDDDNSHSSLFSNFITQKFQCGTCGDKFTEDNESENHIAQEHEFNKSGLRFVDENSLENQTFKGHKFTCEICQIHTRIRLKKMPCLKKIQTMMMVRVKVRQIQKKCFHLEMKP